MSWNLSTGRFNCFGCGARGDMVDFLMIKYSVSFIWAAQTLGAWTPRTSSTYEWQRQRAQLEADIEERRTERQKAEATARACRITLRNVIHSDTRIIFHASERLQEMGGVDAPDCEQKEILWDILKLAHEDRLATEHEYMLACGFEAGQ
jgi:hypothetical protein